MLLKSVVPAVLLCAVLAGCGAAGSADDRPAPRDATPSACPDLLDAHGPDSVTPSAPAARCLDGESESTP